MKPQPGRSRKVAATEGDRYAHTLRRSTLLSAPQQDEFAARFPETAGSPRDMAEWLMARGWITAWQNWHLLEGRHRGFFVGKYRLLQFLSAGGMSRVYLAEHTLLKRPVALKLVTDPQEHDRFRVERFHREGEAAAALVHPNIVRVFDLDRCGRFHYLVMEYVAGRDLSRTVQADGPLPFETAADYVAQAADGLAHVHARRMVHRDVKPSNLLVDADGRVRLSDFGVVKVGLDGDPSLTLDQGVHIIGTVDYLPPEQFLDGHGVDGRADLYSLGCTLYFLLTGHAPFPHGTQPQRIMSHQTAEPPSIHEDRPQTPAGLVEICNRLMAKRPEERYRTAAETAEVLREWRRRWLQGEDWRPSRDPVRLQLFQPESFHSAATPAASATARERGASAGTAGSNPNPNPNPKPKQKPKPMEKPAAPDVVPFVKLKKGADQAPPAPEAKEKPLERAFQQIVELLRAKTYTKAETLIEGLLQAGDAPAAERPSATPCGADAPAACGSGAAAPDGDPQERRSSSKTAGGGKTAGRKRKWSSQVRESELYQALWKFLRTMAKKHKMTMRVEPAGPEEYWVRFEAPGEPARRLGPFAPSPHGFYLAGRRVA